jgi:hypothetical protein
MGTPPDKDDPPPGEGGWQSSGWQSRWQQPAGGQGWQQEPQGSQSQPAGWQQAADGSWVQTGATQTSGKSTAALVMGILGLILCPPIFSTLALIFGRQARNEIDGSGGRIGGRGNATAGIVLGWIGIAFTVLFILLIVIFAAGGDGGDSSPADGPTVLVFHGL